MAPFRFIFAALPLALLAACATPEPAETSLQTAVISPNRKTAPAKIGLEQLKGLKGEQVREALGPPGFLRRDKPAQIWQYRGPACTLDLFLYGADGSETVAHYEVRSQGGIGDKACFDDLVRRAQDRPQT